MLMKTVKAGHFDPAQLTTHLSPLFDNLAGVRDLCVSREHACVQADDRGVPREATRGRLIWIMGAQWRKRKLDSYGVRPDAATGESDMSGQHRILVVYYSRSGTTRRVAEMLASELGADIEPIRERGENASRAGARGYARSLIDALRHRRVGLMSAVHDVSAYDAVVVGAPVWVSSACAPAQTWLEEHGKHIRHLALFCCLGARGSEPALAQMARSAGKSPVATCAITAHDLYRGVDGEKRQVFGEKIRHRLAALEEIESMM